ncbi:hypothetical protein SAMN05660836_00162 [Thermodesulforhabdus norvegica]|uniref:Uncharacterized protein n=1 Tax=Thermodesulforhabdus norvegica TaxID=39841 RepID=A0A1I4QQA5_9BACT|nr:hypothetical protein SAMN05660836_00162 [Thermodesulforhabdus norvegica]
MNAATNSSFPQNDITDGNHYRYSVMPYDLQKACDFNTLVETLALQHSYQFMKIKGILLFFVYHYTFVLAITGS